MPSLSNRFLVATSLLAAAVTLLATAWMSDDAFITLRVIDNFIHGYGLRYNVIERVQVFTHPLWMMFLTPFYVLTREPLVTTMLVSVAVSLGAFWLLAARIAKDIGYGCLLVLLAVASSAIYKFSTSGLETPLTFMLLALLVWQLYRTEKVWIPAGIVGLLLLNRLDLALLVGPAAAYLLLRAKGQRIRIALAVALPELLWMVFSVIYYGAPFPNTAYAKLGTGFGAAELMLRGLGYTKDFAFHDPLLALIIGKAVFDALRSREWRTILLGSGIILYIAYIIIIGGDFMSGRFFAPPGFLALCLLAREPMPQWLAKQAALITLIVFVALGVLLEVRVMGKPIPDVPDSGIVDERRFYYPGNGLISILKDWAEAGHEPVHRLGQKGEKLKAEAQSLGMPVVAIKSAVGMVGYYAGPTVHIFDYLALTDPFLARLPAIPGARVGHYQRKLPPGYYETVINYPSPTTDIVALRPLLNDVILATRAPLFADGRWGAIERLTFGHYNWIYEAHLY